jgi:hypothetical protein
MFAYDVDLFLAYGFALHSVNKTKCIVSAMTFIQRKIVNSFLLKF